MSKNANRLIGLMVRRQPQERKILGSNPACAGIFSGLSYTSDLKIGTPVTTLPGTWTGRPGVSILWLGEMESLVCNFYLVLEVHSHVAGTLSNQPTNKPKMIPGNKHIGNESDFNSNVIIVFNSCHISMHTGNSS